MSRPLGPGPPVSKRLWGLVISEHPSTNRTCHAIMTITHRICSAGFSRHGWQASACRNASRHTTSWLGRRGCWRWPRWSGHGQRCRVRSLTAGTDIIRLHIPFRALVVVDPWWDGRAVVSLGVDKPVLLADCPLPALPTILVPGCPVVPGKEVRDGVVVADGVQSGPGRGGWGHTGR